MECAISSFTTWEQESFDQFMGMVYSLTMWGFGPDKVCWKPARSRGFKVRGFYRSFYPPTILSFPWRMIWQLKVPPSVAFFSWFASLGKILTTDNLHKRRVLFRSEANQEKKATLGGTFSCHIILQGKDKIVGG